MSALKGEDVAPRAELGVTFQKPSLDPKRTALAVVDMIYGDAHRDYGAGKVAQREGRLSTYYFERIDNVVTPAIVRLLAFFRHRGLPVLFVRVRGDDDHAQDWPPTHRLHLVRRGLMPCRPGMKEYEWLPDLEPQPGEVVLEKRSVSLFNSTGAETILNRLGITHLVFTGVTTNYGVGHSAIDACDRSFFVGVVEDGTATYSQQTHDDFLNLNGEYYFRVLTADGVISELRE